MSSYRDDGPDAMIVHCPCGFWAHGRDDMVVGEVYEKHLAGCHQEGVVPEPEVESQPPSLSPHEVMTTAHRLNKLQGEALTLAEHIKNMATIIRADRSLASGAEGWSRLAQYTENCLHAMVGRSTKCP